MREVGSAMSGGLAAVVGWFRARDRRPFWWPAIAAALLHPLFWVMLFGPDPKRGAIGFGGLDALWVFAAFLGHAAILPALGWAFASRSVFAVLGFGGVFAWPVWAVLVAVMLPTWPELWPKLSVADRAVGVVLTVQLLLWPLCFAQTYRAAMGGRAPKRGPA
jgi:hypothetical protein